MLCSGLRQVQWSICHLRLPAWKIAVVEGLAAEAVDCACALLQQCGISTLEWDASAERH